MKYQQSANDVRFRAKNVDVADTIASVLLMAETPKKLAEETSKCFTCSSLWHGKEKIYIFGNNQHNFAEIIKSALDIDVDCYDDNTNSKLFVCKTSCYKRLLKFQRAVEKVEEVKKEIQDSFQGRPRAKRLLRPTDGEQEEMSENQGSLSTNRAKASRTLQFSSANTSSTTCASFCSQELLAGVNPLSYVRGVLSPIQQICPNYRFFPHVETTQEFRPPLTSTPSSSANRRENQRVTLSVQYPSKYLNKTLHGAYQNIGKAVAHGIPSRIATAVMNCPSVSDQIIGKVMKVVSKEVTGLCSKTNPSLLRKTGKEDLEKFDLENVCQEWRERAPVFYSFLLTSAANKRTKSSTWLGGLSLAGSALLKQRNQEMSATAAVMGVLLKNKAVEV